MKRLITIFAFLIPLIIAPSSYAESGSVGGTYEYDGEAISGVEVNLYKIADYDGDDFVFLDGFEPVEIALMTNSELGDYGKALAEVVQNPVATTQTIGGEYGFADLSEGIYLVTYKDIKIGDYTYSALPIVLTMPDANLNRQITLTVKIEKSCPDCVEPEPEPEPLPPDEGNSNTHDAIKIYIRIFVVLIILETLTLFVIIKERKREDSNEKK
jgi:hypothetical protein